MDKKRLHVGSFRRPIKIEYSYSGIPLYHILTVIKHVGGMIHNVILCLGSQSIHW
jgi:hypothetical protein